MALVSDVGSILEASNTWGLIALSLVLMPLNWSLEALKWKLLLKKKENISFPLALKAVFSGATISAVSPNRTGDYFARVFVLKKTKFWEGVFITLIGSYAQSITTLIFGGIAFFTFFTPLLLSAEYISIQNIKLFTALYYISLAVVIILYYKISLLSSVFPKRWNRIHKYVTIFSQYKFSELSIALIISILRYMVFSFQFYILFIAVGFGKMSLIQGLAIISVVFLINTIRPSIALLELGIRGSVVIFVVSVFYANSNVHIENAALTASSLLWLINIILPAIIGLFFIKDLRFFKSRER